MEEIVTGVNWLAVIVGFVVSFGLGWLWFSPKLFGTKWAEGNGLDPSGPDKMPMGAMITQIIGTFLLAWVVGVTAKNEALLTIVLITVTMVFLNAANAMFSGKTSYVRHVDAGFTAVMVIIMIICQGIF